MQKKAILEWLMLGVVLLILTILVIHYVKGRKTRETFLLDSPLLIKLETIAKDTLRQFNVFDGRVFDYDKLKIYLDSKNAVIGAFQAVEVTDRSLKQVIEDLASSRGDYSVLKSKFNGFVMAVTFDNSTQSVVYYTLEQPWSLTTEIFQNIDYMQNSTNSKIYVPAWQYSKQDPSPFFISTECLDMLTKWQNTDDAAVIKQLESSPCLSRENKVKFIGMVILNYLTLLQQNNFGFKTACTDYAAVASNLQNPELRQVFEDINSVCKDLSEVADPVPAQCVKPYNDWLMNDQTSDESDCMTKENKMAFLKRLRKFLEIGASIPVEFLDSFYLVVNQLYSEAKNDRMKDFLKTYTIATDSADKWKGVLDSMFKDVIRPDHVTLNGTQVKYSMLDEDGFSAEAPADGSKSVSVLEFGFSAPHRFRSVITKPNSAGDHIVKFSLSYEDPFVPNKYVDFDRIMYANEGPDGVKINSLDEVTTSNIRIFPLEWSDKLGARVGFEGVQVKLDMCSQTMSVCEHASLVEKERKFYTALDRKYQQERSAKLKLSTSLAALQGQVDSLGKGLHEEKSRTQAAKAARCPPAPSCLPYVVVPPIGRSRKCSSLVSPTGTPPASSIAQSPSSSVATCSIIRHPGCHDDDASCLSCYCTPSRHLQVGRLDSSSCRLTPYQQSIFSYSIIEGR